MAKNKQKGTGYIFTSGMGLLLTLGMTAWILFVIIFKGLSFFWPGEVVTLNMKSGPAYMGEVWDESDEEGAKEQIQLKIGNRDLYGQDFKWFDKEAVENNVIEAHAVIIEREEYGNFYGLISSLHQGGKEEKVSTDPDFEKVDEAHIHAVELAEDIKALQLQAAIVMQPLDILKHEMAKLAIAMDTKSAEYKALISSKSKEAEALEKELVPKLEQINSEILRLNEDEKGRYIMVRSADEQMVRLQLSTIVRFYRPNQMNIINKTTHYIAKVYEFIFDEPRESNTEGGVFPAIFGTVLMVLLMSIAVVPIGVLAAIYLNEYATQGTIIRFIRMSVNNLAGVPSIVFGVFGLGFFVYIIGGSLDQLFFSDSLPEPTFGTGGIFWASLTLALLTLPVVIVATEESILAVPRANKEGALALGSTKWQMIRKIVLPNAMPGVLTGLILAISRGAGEVAPLMITGVVKLAPSLALDGTFPFLHLDRKFMHLGFHIYDVGFQSPNVEAAKPMVYSTALLLIVIVVLLNILAISIRSRLRKKFKTSAF